MLVGGYAAGARSAERLGASAVSGIIKPAGIAVDDYAMGSLVPNQTRQHLAVTILGLLNDDSAFPDTLNNVVSAIQESTDIEAVGIRLRNGDEFGFFAARGFSDAFLDAENSLTVRNEQGAVCRDEHGQPVLECICGLVLAGHGRGVNQVFTCSGSCFLNHGESSLVFDAGHGDPRVHVRGRCFREGYESIAWVPIRAHQASVGLLLLCDKRPDRFSAELLEFLEGLSASIGLALTRKQAEEELSLNSAKLKLALTSTGMGVWSWHISEDQRYFDDQTCKLLGLDAKAFTGKADEFFGAVHPDDREAVKRALRHTLTVSGMYETEYRSVWQDGSIHHISARGTCIRDAQGQPIRIEGVVWDITEHRLAEAALRRNEALQHAIISNIFDVIAIVDRTGINRFKSNNLRTWFGWQPEEVVGKSAAEQMHPDDLNRIQEQFRAISTQPGATMSAECRYLCKDGSYKWIEVHAVNLLHDPNIAGLLLNYHDISQRKRAQAALHESEERYRVLFQNSRDALMTMAPPAWRFTDGNAAAVALFGLRDAAEFKSRAPWELAPEFQPDGAPSKQKASAMIETAMQTGACAFEWMHRTAQGEDFPATVSLTRSELNGIPLLQATVRDESERQRMLARMAQSDRLASMGMLAAGIAHEINNPLAFVRYNLESLAEDLPRLTAAMRRACDIVRESLGEAAHRALLGQDSRFLEDAALADMVARGAEALEGIQRIGSITRALSTFSRVEQVNCTQVNVAVAIDAAINMARNEVTHRARLSSTVAPLPNVWASEGKLSHAFLNLIVNAAQAIDEGDVANNVISIRAWAEAQEVVVEVSDTGKGIDPENLERIFEPFYTTKRWGDGPGLGLSISKNILTEFGGTLSASSEVGVGSRFTVRLPVMKESSSSVRQPDLSAPGATLETSGRILLIDDEPNIIRSLTRLLGSTYTLVSVASGKEAQELVSADPHFDVIICDLMMSEMSGTEFHAWLTQHHPILGSQLIFLTGGAFSPNAREYLAKVGNLTIQKPFDADLLRREVANAVRAMRHPN